MYAFSKKKCWTPLKIRSRYHFTHPPPLPQHPKIANSLQCLLSSAPKVALGNWFDCTFILFVHCYNGRRIQTWQISCCNILRTKYKRNVWLSVQICLQVDIDGLIILCMFLQLLHNEEDSISKASEEASRQIVNCLVENVLSLEERAVGKLKLIFL